MTVVGSQVIAANVAHDEPKFENLDDPVLVLLPVRISGEVRPNKFSLVLKIKPGVHSQSILCSYNAQGFLMSGSEVCVSWDFNLSDWTSRGCRTSVGRNGTILCTCDHLTNFAVIVVSLYSMH